MSIEYIVVGTLIFLLLGLFLDSFNVSDIPVKNGLCLVVEARGTRRREMAKTVLPWEC